MRIIFAKVIILLILSRWVYHDRMLMVTSDLIVFKWALPAPGYKDMILRGITYLITYVVIKLHSSDAHD